MKRKYGLVMAAATALCLTILNNTHTISLAAPDDESGFTPLFNGKDLAGWEGDTKGYVVEDGELEFFSPPGVLCWTATKVEI